MRYTFLLLFLFQLTITASIPNDHIISMQFDGNLNCTGADVSFFDYNDPSKIISPVYHEGYKGQAMTMWWEPRGLYCPNISVINITKQSWGNSMAVCFMYKPMEEDEILPGRIKLPNGQWSNTDWNIKDTLAIMGVGYSFFHNYGFKAIRDNDTLAISIDYGFQDSVWSQVVITIDNGYLSVHVDGNNVYNGDVGTLSLKEGNVDFTPLSYLCRIVTDKYYKKICLASLIDELYVWNRILSNTEISNIFDENITPIEFADIQEAKAYGKVFRILFADTMPTNVVIDNNNIDSILPLNNGHSWVGSNNDVEFNWPDRKTLLVNYKTIQIPPTISVGDIISVKNTSSSATLSGGIDWGITYINPPLKNNQTQVSIYKNNCLSFKNKKYVNIYTISGKKTYSSGDIKVDNIIIKDPGMYIIKANNESFKLIVD